MIKKTVGYVIGVVITVVVVNLALFAGFVWVALWLLRSFGVITA